MNSSFSNHSSQSPRKRLTIAIDGPAAAGKSTLARLLAKELGYFHLDTGAMYRAVGWKAHKMGVSMRDPEAVTELARNIKLQLKTGPEGEIRISADGHEITSAIRTLQAGEWASQVSAISGVRRAMVKLQQQMGAGGGVVAEGRDMQTVVFPRAEVKIFLTASVEERAHRRYLELNAKHSHANLEEITREMQKRDERDSGRADSPLKPAPDAVIVDTDGKSIQEALAALLAVVKQVGEK